MVQIIRILNFINSAHHIAAFCDVRIMKAIVMIITELYIMQPYS